MAGRPRRLRPYRASGLYRGTPTAPPQQQAGTGLRAQLIADHFDGEPTAAQEIILGLLGAAAAKHRDAWNYLQSLPRPWVDRKSQRVWQIVHDLSKLERHVARLVAALVDPALERRPVEVEDIRTIAAREATGTTDQHEDQHDSPADADHPAPRPE